MSKQPERETRLEASTHDTAPTTVARNFAFSYKSETWHKPTRTPNQHNHARPAGTRCGAVRLWRSTCCARSQRRSPPGRPRPLLSRARSPPALRASLLHGSPPPAANRPSALSHHTAKQPRSRLELQLLRRLRESSLASLPSRPRVWRHRDHSRTTGARLHGDANHRLSQACRQAAKGLTPPPPLLPPPLRQCHLSPPHLSALHVARPCRLESHPRTSSRPHATQCRSNPPPRKSTPARHSSGRNRSDKLIPWSAKAA